MHSVHAGSAVKLSAEYLVGLHKSFELASQVSVLTLKALGVLVESVSLGQQISVVSAVLA